MLNAIEERLDLRWVEDLPELDDLQTGAIRRIANLSRQLQGDWSGMMGRDIAMSEDFSALRFQIAYMSYALVLAHVHRLPAAPGVFKQPLDNLIVKMLHPDVWHYWSDVSTGMGPSNKDLGPLPREWDPVAKENIMYSAYLQSMALMFHYVFRDAKYAEPKSLRLRMKTLFWMQGGFLFEYDEKSLTDVIYWQMAEQGFLGVACEPGLIFQACNQPNMIGFRMHDLIYGGTLAKDAEKGYVKAWDEFGMLDDSGNFKSFIKVNSRTPVILPGPQLNCWLMTLLHSWNPEIVEKQYPLLMEEYVLDGPAGTKWVKPRALPLPPDPGEEPVLPVLDFAWAACAASEVGDEDTLNGMLRYADLMLSPAWQDGGYYYKRRDANLDADGYFIGMDAAAGNALLHYARLNVKDGLNTLYGGLPDTHFSQPALIDLPDDVDVRRAVFDQEHNALVLTLGTLPTGRTIRLGIRVSDHADIPFVLIDGKPFDGAVDRTDDGFALTFRHRDRATLVLQW